MQRGCGRRTLTSLKPSLDVQADAGEVLDGEVRESK